MHCDECNEWENYDTMTYCDACGRDLCTDCDRSHGHSCSTADPGEEED